MRHRTAVLTVAAAGMIIAACGTGCGGRDNHGNVSVATVNTQAAVAEAALDALLLTPNEIDAAMGVTGMSPREKIEKLPDGNTKKWPQGWKWPAGCMYAYGPAERTAYASSGNTSVRGRSDAAPTSTPGIGEMDPEFTQVVVLFPSAVEASAFFASSAKAWPACSDHQFTTPGNLDHPEVNWQVGAVSTANETLSTAVSLSMAPGPDGIGGTCQRVLTVRNNVAIDVSACAGKDPGAVGVKLTNQIAGKVERQ